MPGLESGLPWAYLNNGLVQLSRWCDELDKRCETDLVWR